MLRQLQHYRNVDAFYADRGGEHSPECDFGGGHFTEPEGRLPRHLRERWRVSVVAVTGDVYAEAVWTRERRLFGRVRLLGRLAGGPYGHIEQGRVVVVRSAIRSRDKARAFVDADRAFADWAQADGRTLEWFVKRLADFNAARAEGETAVTAAD